MPATDSVAPKMRALSARTPETVVTPGTAASTGPARRHRDLPRDPEQLLEAYDGLVAEILPASVCICALSLIHI